MCFACLCICASCAYVVPVGDRKGYHIPWNWSHSCVCTTTWELRIKSGSSARTISALDHQALSPDQLLLFKTFILHMCAKI